MCASAENRGHAPYFVGCLPSLVFAVGSSDRSQFEDSLYKLQFRCADTLLERSEEMADLSVSTSWDANLQ